MNDIELVDWLQLGRTPKIGPAQFARLLDRFGSAGAALDWLKTPQGMAKANIERLYNRSDAADELDKTRDTGGMVVSQRCDLYPKLLREIPDPPPLITVLGNMSFLNVTSVAVVGARNASGNGCNMAKSLSTGVSAAEITIVSGLARGIDTAAHQGGLLGAGSTVAVIASGVDIAYPSQNRSLMDQIIEQGVVVSERPLGAAPLARHFPRRNRIISGLSRAIVVVEAAEKSGSLMTARLGLDHGREVMAVPGSPMDPRHRGTNRLLRDGAQMVETVHDILENIPAHLRAPARHPTPTKQHQEPAVHRSRKQPQRVPTGHVGGQPNERNNASVSEGVELAQRMKTLLSPEPLAVDELIRQCHASAGEVQNVLLQFELDGLISRHPGNRVALELS